MREREEDRKEKTFCHQNTKNHDTHANSMEAPPLDSGSDKAILHFGRRIREHMPLKCGGSPSHISVFSLDGSHLWY